MTPTTSSSRFSAWARRCSLLADEADWNDPTWILDPQTLEGLAKAVEAIADRASGLTFQAIWIGETAETEGRVRLKELLRDIRSNAIRNKHVYRVGKVGESLGTEL